MSIRCKYVASKRDGVLIIIDWSVGMSVTNDIENVVKDLSEKGLLNGEPPLIYCDSEGWYDGIEYCKAGEYDDSHQFIAFVHIRTKIQDVAVQMAIGFRRQGRL